MEMQKSNNKQLTLLYCDRTVRSSHRRCSIKKMFLKISQYPQEAPVLESLFKKVAALQACNFIKKRPQHRCFPVNIAKFLRLPIFKNICERLFFDYFNGSLLHGPKVSRSRLYESPSHKSSFLVFIWHLPSEPSPDLRSKTMTIPLISQLSFYIGYFGLF